MQHDIHTTDETPINVRQYRFPPTLKDEHIRQTDELLKNGIIQPSNSSFNTPPLDSTQKRLQKTVKNDGD